MDDEKESPLDCPCGQPARVKQKPEQVWEVTCSDPRCKKVKPVREGSEDIAIGEWNQNMEAVKARAKVTFGGERTHRGSDFPKK